jgi:CRISPR-associated protein Cas6
MVFTSVDTLADKSEKVEPVVELFFPVQGTSAPADHGYALFAALVHLQAEIRDRLDVSILTIPGFGDRQGKILLTPQSGFRIRVPISSIPLVYGFAGKQIRLGIHPIQIGIPSVNVLESNTKLRARIVTIKGFVDVPEFIRAVERQLDAWEITGQVTVPLNREGHPLRKTIKIQRHTIIGFTTEVDGLNETDSIKLQSIGIGGRRHMGAGYFLPCEGNRHV